MHTTPHRFLRRFPAVRLALCLVLAASAAAGLVQPAAAAGIITHAEVVERAANLVDGQAYPELAALLRDYRQVVNYGSMFPDWAYARFDGALAEVLHDTCGLPSCDTYRFREALAAALVPAFRRPNSEDDRKAIAFLLGLVAHQETDNPWHFSQPGSPLALEQALSFQNYQLGTAVEFVIELFAARQAVGLENLPEFWIPEQALLAAYRAVGRDDITAQDLREGTQRQKWVYAAEIASARLVIHRFLLPANRLLLRSLETYPAGGLDDCARRTAEAWQQTWDWLSAQAGNFAPSQPPP